MAELEKNNDIEELLTMGADKQKKVEQLLATRKAIKEALEIITKRIWFQIVSFHFLLFIESIWDDGLLKSFSKTSVLPH